MQVGNTTVAIGGGTAILTLPDVEFTKRVDNVAPGTVPAQPGIKDSEDFGDEIGWNFNGSIERSIGAGRSIALNGFWSEIDKDDKQTCTSPASGTANCVWIDIVDDPTDVDNLFPAVAGNTATINSDREVSHWGLAIEAKKDQSSGIMGITQAPPYRFIGLGADVRGIDQDLRLSTIEVTNPTSLTYNEDLETRYYGGYLAYGGTYSPLLFKGLWQRLGLQSSFRLQGGVYWADTDYDGRVDVAAGGVTSTTRLSLSSDDAAFIGGLSLMTSKRIGRRSLLTLKSDYEYYSWVPDMRYNETDVQAGGTAITGNVGTSIGDDDAFSMRTSLRLTIKLGPDSLFDQPVK